MHTKNYLLKDDDMETFIWLSQKNNQVIKKKCLFYAIVIPIFFIAFQKYYGMVGTGYTMFLTLAIIFNRIIYESFLANGFVSVLIIYQEFGKLIKILSFEANKKSGRVIACAIPIIIMLNYFFIHEEVKTPWYLLIIEFIILAGVALLQAVLHLFLLFYISSSIKKFIDIILLFINAYIVTLYTLNITYLEIYLLLYSLLLAMILIYVMKHVNIEKFMLGDY